MPPTLATRKPVDELTAAELETFPVWEFAMDEEGVIHADKFANVPHLTGKHSVERMIESLDIPAWHWAKRRRNDKILRLKA